MIIPCPGRRLNTPKHNIYHWMAVTAYFEFRVVTLRGYSVAFNVGRPVGSAHSYGAGVVLHRQFDKKLIAI